VIAAVSVTDDSAVESARPRERTKTALIVRAQVMLVVPRPKKTSEKVSA
jgi:hypothetical protein